MTNTVEETYKKTMTKTRKELVYLLVTTVKDYESNYTPNTEVQKKVEEGVRGFVKYFNSIWDFSFSTAPSDLEEKAEQYLKEVQTKGDTDE